MKLLLLRCPVCGEGLKPRNEDIIFGCPNCQAAVSLTDQGIHQTEVRYAEPERDLSEVTHWLPIWVFNARVHIKSRETQGGSGKHREEAERMWQEPRRLYVPAWEQPVPQARQQGHQMVLRQTVWNPIERPAGAVITAAVIDQQDARQFLNFIILSIEAERKDWLRDLKFDIEAGSAVLWAVPARDKGNGNFEPLTRNM